MVTYQFEVWAPKGERALMTYETADRAWQHVDDAAHAVPGLRVEIVTTTTRRTLAERPRKLRRVA